jgi:hypothetical protein
MRFHQEGKRKQHSTSLRTYRAAYFWQLVKGAESWKGFA